MSMSRTFHRNGKAYILREVGECRWSVAPADPVQAAASLTAFIGTTGNGDQFTVQAFQAIPTPFDTLDDALAAAVHMLAPERAGKASAAVREWLMAGQPVESGQR